MIPAPTAEDLARDAETDYKWLLSNDGGTMAFAYCRLYQWARVAYNKMLYEKNLRRDRADAAERERDELRAEVERLKLGTITTRSAFATAAKSGGVSTYEHTRLRIENVSRNLEPQR